jgi:2-C-methyl-D-erythritol 4-phosphate cytidylyltransferase
LNRQSQKIWGLIPAAGLGKRMNAQIPKQYLLLKGKSILEHSLNCLLSHPRIQKVILVIAKDDHCWPSIEPKLPPDRFWVAQGGAERYLSVYAGLMQLAEIASPEDWVLVHDAVRPYVQLEIIQRLIAAVENHSVGGLLAMPVRDTLKLTDERGVVIKTIERSRVWQAQTPQMFRLGILIAALEQVIAANHPVTDESAALEYIGAQPLVVPGSASNIKITYPEDLRIICA